MEQHCTVEYNFFFSSSFSIFNFRSRVLDSPAAKNLGARGFPLTSYTPLPFLIAGCSELKIQGVEKVPIQHTYVMECGGIEQSKFGTGNCTWSWRQVKIIWKFGRKLLFRQMKSDTEQFKSPTHFLTLSFLSKTLSHAPVSCTVRKLSSWSLFRRNYIDLLMCWEIPQFPLVLFWWQFAKLYWEEPQSSKSSAANIPQFCPLLSYQHRKQN